MKRSLFSGQVARPLLESRGDDGRMGSTLARLAPSSSAGAAYKAPDLPEPTCARPGIATDVPRCMVMVERVMAYYRNLSGRSDPATECLRLASGKGPPQVLEVLAQLAPPWRDHAIASVYAVLMPRQRRKRLGVYFTPPHLVEHLLRRMCAFGLDPAQHSLRDPSAGGAAFLVPLAREMASTWLSEGVYPGEIIARLRARLHGREIDSGLASVANALLRRMLVGELRISADLVTDLSIVKVGDSLRIGDSSDGDHELSNPPYLRLAARGHRRWKKHFSDIAGGRLNLYAMFVRRALDQVAPNGLIGHVLPASFLGGPEFSAFRRRIMQLADILVLDVVEKRKGVFLDATQDACFVVLRRRTAPVDNPPATTASSGVLRHCGEFVLSGHAALPADGSPWSLPGNDPVDAAKLADYGYRGTVGYLVANRQSQLLHRHPARGRLPLVWAKCITPDGLFDFDRGRNAEKAGGHGFVTVPKNAAYVIRVPCVLVQRTSSKNQSRRLTAAAVPKDFFRHHEGFVGENHVIILVPTRADAVAPERLAAVLNGPEANAMLSRVCGSASISVRVLENLPLPRPRSGLAAAGGVDEDERASSSTTGSSRR